MSRFREFWINDNAEGDNTFTVSRTSWFGYIHVIEISALTDVQAKLVQTELILTDLQAKYDALKLKADGLRDVAKEVLEKNSNGDIIPVNDLDDAIQAYDEEE